MSNAKNTRVSSAKRSVSGQPTLHGLLISRSFSGTVVRGLLFAIPTFILVFVGIAAASDVTSVGALGAWIILAIAYVIFDILYVLMAKVRPLHPRVDRVVLPGVLVFSLIAILAPVLFVGPESVHPATVWASAGGALIVVLGARLALLLHSVK